MSRSDDYVRKSYDDVKKAIRVLTDFTGATISTVFSGLRVRVKITNLIITDIASPLPPIALANRNSIMIENRSADPIFIGEADVAASGIKEGWEIYSTSVFSTDITDQIVLYGIAPAGKTVNLKIMELA